jgi:hypothetical protein
VLPPAQNSPALHALHFDPDINVDNGVITVPAGQSDAETQAIWFGCEDEVPAWQGAQSLSEVALGKVIT